MKRKRAARKKAVSKKATPSLNVDEQAFINFVAQSVRENSVADEINHTNDQLNPGIDQNRTEKNLRSSSSSSSSSDNEESFHLDLDSSGDEAATISRKKQTVSKQGLQKKWKASIQTTSTPVMPPRGSVSNFMSSRGSGAKAMALSNGLSSSSRKESPSLKILSQDPRYNKLELKASLAVIKKVMEMEEAGPFNTPVDPVAQGIPDYFNVVQTPMDFGTIRSNLQNGVKYLNSEDVYKDVNYIWENCSKYNKKGDYIVYLMKRVKKNFMKYWKSAGLRSDVPEEHNGPSLSVPFSDHDMWQSRRDALSAVNRMVTNSNRMHLDKFGGSQSHSRQPQPSTTQVPLFSQSHAGVGSSYTDVTRTRAHDFGVELRGARGSSGKTTPLTSARPSAPSFVAPSGSQATHREQPSAHGPELSALLRRIQHLLPIELPPEQEAEKEQEQEQEQELESETEASDDEVGDSALDGRIEITVVDDVMLPSEKCSSTIRKIFEKKFHIDGAKWKTVPQEMKDYYFEEFKKHFSWDKSIDDQVRKAWKKKAAARYSEMLTRIRNKGVKPEYLPEEIWEKWWEVWSDPSHMRISLQNALNRRRGDENGVALACHTGGSVVNLEHKKRLTEQLGREPTPHELFVYTHTRKHDGKTFVHEKAKEVNDQVESIKEQMAQNSSTVDESQVFFEAAGGKVKSRVYGLGSAGKDYYKLHKSAYSTYTSRKESEELEKKLENLQSKLQSTEERHEERYNVLLETIMKQTEIISALQQKIESTPPQFASSEVLPVASGKKNPKGKAKTRAR